MNSMAPGRPLREDREAAKVSTQRAGWALDFGHDRQHLRPAEVAKVLSVSDQQVRDLVELGFFVAVAIGDGGTRQHLRLYRPSVEAWWRERYLEANAEECLVPELPVVTTHRERLHKLGLVGGRRSKPGGSR